MERKLPKYLKTYSDGLLQEKIEISKEILHHCRLCPRECGVNRLAGEKGICKTLDKARVHGYHPHFGEEKPLVGNQGSGTIFFSNCSLLCNFCQNYELSHQGQGQEVSSRYLAEMMIYLQNSGCHNINLVTPTHVVPQILDALLPAIEMGLNIPLIYNTSAYDEPATLQLLDGVIDIYMPDFKFWDEGIAEKTCRAADYPERARLAVKEMYRQVGDLAINHSGLAERGLLVRHLVLPGRLAGTQEVMNFIATEISPDTYVNIMAQYHPCGQAYEINAISESISTEDYEMAIQAARQAGIHRLDKPGYVVTW